MSPLVLVVEPHADLRSAIVAALRRADFRCDAVGSEGEARLKLRESDYAYILLDVDAPTPVQELCDSLLAQPSMHGRVVVISDRESQPEDLGHLLQKPFDSLQLLAQVGR